MTVVEKAERHHSAHSIIDLRTSLEGLVAAGSFAEIALQVALNGALIADTEVETQVQIVSNL